MNKALEKLFKTKNKIYYYSLDRNEKSNYILMKDLIKIFEDDFNFLENVLSHKNENITKVELADIYYDILMLIDKNYYDNEEIQKKKNKYFDELDKIIYDLYKIDLKKYNPNDEDRIKFEKVIFNENYSENIDKYIAKNMINIIFSSFDFENYLHKEFTSFEELEKFGIDEFIFDILDRYDYDLTLYSYHNKMVINGIYSKLFLIKENWNNYYLEKKERKYSKLMRKLSRYKLANNINNYIYFRLLYYVAYKLNTLEEFFFQSNNPNIELSFDNLIRVYDYCKEIDEKNDFFFLKHYLKLKDIFKEELKEEVGDDFICRKITKR